MDIKIPVAYPVGSTVYTLRGFRIICREVTAVHFPEFQLTAKTTTPPPPRYRLSDDTNLYCESQIFSSSDELISKLEQQ